MRVADEKKEKLFVEYFTSGETLANATKSAQKAGYNKNPSQVGYYLKRKYQLRDGKYTKNIKKKPVDNGFKITRGTFIVRFD